MAKLTGYRLLSFDVYGTLIDWETGVITGMKPLLEQLGSKQPTREQTLDIYHDLEKAQQYKTPDMPYSQLASRVYAQFASRVGLKEPTAQESEVFGQSREFQSNQRGTPGRSQIRQDITAQEVDSYKPDPRNFEYMLETVRAELGVEKEEVLQTAQSQFHDHHPARDKGIKSVWIERNGTMGNQSEKIYDWKFSTLGDMADAVEKELGDE